MYIYIYIYTYFIITIVNILANRLALASTSSDVAAAIRTSSASRTGIVVASPFKGDAHVPIRRVRTLAPTDPLIYWHRCVFLLLLLLLLLL